MSPCKDCIKLLSAAKIKKCIYKEEYRDILQVKELCKFFDIELFIQLNR
jgi:deoxycytidylate deaminase